jgi:hypothetical protein
MSVALWPCSGRTEVDAWIPECIGREDQDTAEDQDACRVSRSKATNYADEPYITSGGVSLHCLVSYEGSCQQITRHWRRMPVR